jgi:hypothetical protein
MVMVMILVIRRCRMASWRDSCSAIAAVAALGLASCTGGTETTVQPGLTPSPSGSSDDPGADQCQAVPPGHFPSGAAPGEPLATGDQHFVWGAGRDRVAQQVGNPLGIGKNWPQRVNFRDGQARLVPIGDPGQIAFVFTVDGCTYTTWVGPGLTLGEAKDYISTY